MFTWAWNKVFFKCPVCGHVFSSEPIAKDEVRGCWEECPKCWDGASESVKCTEIVKVEECP